jgi:hypothetical protein
VERGPNPEDGRGRGELVLVFSTNTRILLAEELLDSLDLPFVLIPVPKEVNPNCGLAMSLQEEDAELVMPVLEKADLRPKDVYRRRGGAFTVQPPEGGF